MSVNWRRQSTDSPSALFDFLQLWDTYVHVNSLQECIRPRDEADPDTRGENLGQAVETQDSSDLGFLELKVEI